MVPAETNMADMSPHKRKSVKKVWMDGCKRGPLRDYEIEGVADKAFRQFIRICDKRQIRLIVLNMPVHVEFMETYSKDEYSDFIKYMTTICEKEGIDFFNLQECDGLDYSHFKDPIHLNRKGAELISRYIAKEILLPEMEGLWDAAF